MRFYVSNKTIIETPPNMSNTMLTWYLRLETETVNFSQNIFNDMKH